jgi:CRISPR-associated protein Cas2
MIVLVLTDCPNALRGDLTRWLFQIDTNIYVGKQSARVREMIWKRVIETAGKGRAVMVYPAKNEQGFDFHVWGATWQPIDFDGLKLMLRPHPNRVQANTDTLKPGFSKAAKHQTAKRFANNKQKSSFPNTYLVVDVETTGLQPDKDEIIEIGAIKVTEGTSEIYQALIRTSVMIPQNIERLTGITNELLVREGRELEAVIKEFREFAGELPFVSHNIAFDMNFLRKAYEKCSLSAPNNLCIDTLRMARKLLDDPRDYKLGTLMKYFDMEQSNLHRGVGDCSATVLLYDKLRAILVDNTDEK